MKIVKAIQRLIDAFEKLPGIGPRTAQRLTFYLLHVPQTEIEEFANALVLLKKETKICSVCHNVGESDPCFICSDPHRDKSLVMVVENPLDILALERTGKYFGVYHVLHGAINPLENIGPEELFIDDLIKRIKFQDLNRVKEVILATNPTMEGEATAMYISKRIKELNNGKIIKVTRLGMGIPTGSDLEYADELTLREAILGRREI